MNDSSPNSDSSPRPPQDAPLDADPIRAHVFDGDIREYDKCLPNWWLTCFWGAIGFALVYWVAFYMLPFGKDAGLELKAEMAANAARATHDSGVIDDPSLWRLSQQAATVAAGKATYTTTCAACHQPDLSGAIGPNLRDTAWIHGGRPLEIMNTVTTGVLEKGMPTWGPVLGKQKITEVVAFILSFHKEGERVQPAPPWIPQAPGAPVVSQVNAPATTVQ
jgi:cytochrome c oxidase cbb3-type subunit 3